jgi:ribosomal protein S18 acetylase RimI-like enzyme
MSRQYSGAEKIPMTELNIRLADLDDKADQLCVFELLNGYACDPMGQGKPFSNEIRERLIPELKKQANAVILLAFADEPPIPLAPAGLAICFVGFSTFRAKPILNIHDFCVSPEYQGQGVGKKLMAAVEQDARARGCAKVTLEVRDDNARAQKLYVACGFDAGKRGGDAMQFWGKTV